MHVRETPCSLCAFSQWPFFLLGSIPEQSIDQPELSSVTETNSCTTLMSEGIQTNTERLHSGIIVKLKSYAHVYKERTL